MRGVVLPSVGITSTMKDPLPTFATPEVIVRSVPKVAPLFGGEGEPRRWYVPVDIADPTRLKRVRTQIFDSFLAVLRALHETGAEALLTVGEGALPVWAMFSDQ